MTTTKTNTTTNRPVHSIRSGSVSAAVWKNETHAGAFFSVTFKRSFADDSERGYSDTNSFGSSDLLDLRRCITSCEQFMAEQPA